MMEGMENSPFFDKVDEITYATVKLLVRYIPIYIIGLFFIIWVPSLLNISLGVHEIYKHYLKILFEWANEWSKDDVLEEDNSYTTNPPLDQNTRLKLSSEPKIFEISDLCIFVTSAMHAIVDDEVTKRFTSEELSQWNIMSRNRSDLNYNSWKMSFVWLFGIIFRYFFLLPNRLILIAMTLIVVPTCAVLIAILPKRFRELGSRYLLTFTSRIIIASLGINVKFHKDSIPKYGICVANHTTPLDVVLLMSVQPFLAIGQKQQGIQKLFHNIFTMAGCLFFDRAESSDRTFVLNRLRSSANDRSKPPIIIFPEGTCINNTSVMLFRKGTFEMTDTVNPISIKYNSMYGDAFLDTTTTTFVMYLLKIISSWMIDCEIWFSHPITRLPDESVLSFANRTRDYISKRANLVPLDWDGQLKRSVVPPSLKSSIQKEFANSILKPKIPERITFLKKLSSLDKYVDTVEGRISSSSRSNDGKEEIIQIRDDNLVGLKKWRYWSVGNYLAKPIIERKPCTIK